MQILRLFHEVEGAATSLGGSGADEVRKQVMNDVNKRIFELIHSKTINEKLGGIAAIGKVNH